MNEIKAFLEELDTQLAGFQDILLEYEKNPSHDLLEEIFRRVHTIKGVSGFVGLERLQEISHRLEDILSQIRDEGKSPLPHSQLIDVLLSYVDYLESLREVLANGGEETSVDVPEVLKEALFGEPKVEEPAEATSEEERALPGETDFGISFSKGNPTHVLEVELAQDIPLRDLKALLIVRNVSESTELLKVEPSLEEVEKGEFGKLRLYLSLKAGEEEKVLTVANVEGVIDVKLIPIGEAESISGEKFHPSATLETKSEIQEVRQEKAPPRTVRYFTQSDTVRVSISKLDDLLNLVGELVIVNSAFNNIAQKVANLPDSKQVYAELREKISELFRISSALQESIMRARMIPIGEMFSRFKRVVRDISRELGKEVDLVIEGEDTELDKKVVDRLADPLVHLVRNAIDHGIEPPEEREAKGKPRKGTVYLSAAHEGNHIIISVADDGRGIDIEKVKQKAIEKGFITSQEAQNLSEEELLELIFLPGFSTSENVSEISGRGVGMDVVKRVVEELNGYVEIYTEKDQGTEVVIYLPLTLAIIQAILFRVGSEIYALPIASIREMVEVSSGEIYKVNEREVMKLRDRVVSVLKLDELLEADARLAYFEKAPVIVVSYKDEDVAFLVHELMDTQDIVIKPLAQHYRDIEGIAGASILGDGTVCLILDPQGLINVALKRLEAFSLQRERGIFSLRSRRSSSLREILSTGRDSLKSFVKASSRRAANSLAKLMGLEPEDVGLEDPEVGTVRRRNIDRILGGSGEVHASYLEWEGEIGARFAVFMAPESLESLGEVFGLDTEEDKISLFKELTNIFSAAYLYTLERATGMKSHHEVARYQFGEVKEVVDKVFEDFHPSEEILYAKEVLKIKENNASLVVLLVPHGTYIPKFAESMGSYSNA